MKLRYLLMTASVVAMGASTAAFAASSKNFVHDASIANAFEIESSKLAVEKSSRTDVKSFAKTMISDHTKTGKKLEEVLKTSKSDLKPEEALDKKHQATLDALKSAPEGEFDGQYLSAQNDAHKEAVDLFGDYAEDGKDAPLKTFAAETLPTLKGHLTHVEQLRNVKH